MTTKNYYNTERKNFLSKITGDKKLNPELIVKYDIKEPTFNTLETDDLEKIINENKILFKKLININTHIFNKNGDINKALYDILNNKKQKYFSYSFKDLTRESVWANGDPITINFDTFNEFVKHWIIIFYEKRVSMKTFNTSLKLSNPAKIRNVYIFNLRANKLLAEITRIIDILKKIYNYTSNNSFNSTFENNTYNINSIEKEKEQKRKIAQMIYSITKLKRPIINPLKVGYELDLNLPNNKFDTIYNDHIDFLNEFINSNYKFNEELEELNQKIQSEISLLSTNNSIQQQQDDMPPQFSPLSGGTKSKKITRKIKITKNNKKKSTKN
jgi:hypothetical protein